MWLYKIIQDNGSYEHGLIDATIKCSDSVYFIVAENTHKALMVIIEKTKCKVQDLTINEICKVGQIMGAHFTPTEKI